MFYQDSLLPAGQTERGIGIKEHSEDIHVVEPCRHNIIVFEREGSRKDTGRLSFCPENRGIESGKWVAKTELVFACRCLHVRTRSPALKG